MLQIISCDSKVYLLELQVLVDDQQVRGWRNLLLTELYSLERKLSLPVHDKVLWSGVLEENNWVGPLILIVGWVHCDQELVLFARIVDQVSNRFEGEVPLVAFVGTLDFPNFNTSCFSKRSKIAHAGFENDLLRWLIQSKGMNEDIGILIPEGNCATLV